MLNKLQSLFSLCVLIRAKREKNWAKQQTHTWNGNSLCDDKHISHFCRPCVGFRMCLVLFLFFACLSQNKQCFSMRLHIFGFENHIFEVSDKLKTEMKWTILKNYCEINLTWDSCVYVIQCIVLRFNYSETLPLITDKRSCSAVSVKGRILVRTLSVLFWDKQAFSISNSFLPLFCSMKSISCFQ